MATSCWQPQCGHSSCGIASGRPKPKADPTRSVRWRKNARHGKSAVAVAVAVAAAAAAGVVAAAGIGAAIATKAPGPAAAARKTVAAMDVVVVGGGAAVGTAAATPRIEPSSFPTLRPVCYAGVCGG